VIWTFFDQVVKVEKGWVEQEFVLLIILAGVGGARVCALNHFGIAK
jgi:hypothetical protein